MLLECLWKRTTYTLSRRELSLSLLKIHSIAHDVLLDHRHVGKALKELMKNVEPSEDAEVSDNELEDMVFLSFDS